MSNEKQNPEETGLISSDDASYIEHQLQDLTRELIATDNLGESKAIIEKYNAYLVKKSAIRTGKLEKLYDEIVTQMLLRFKNRSGEFSNKDLLDYLNSVQAALDKSIGRLNNVDEAPIQLSGNQTQVNINVLDGFTHEQKSNIADAIKSILQQSANPTTYYSDDYTETNQDEVPNDKGEDEN